MDNMEKYKNIINLPHHVSTKHPHMSRRNRAAQFAPFAALVGHEEAVEETARWTSEKVEIDENLKELLDEKILEISKNIINNPEVTITYFEKDKRKNGGKYITIKEKIKKIDNYKKEIVLQNNQIISINDILNIN